METNRRKQQDLHYRSISLLSATTEKEQELDRARKFLAEYDNENDSLAIIRIRNTRVSILEHIEYIKKELSFLLEMRTEVVDKLTAAMLEEMNEMNTPKEAPPSMLPLFADILKPFGIR